MLYGYAIGIEVVVMNGKWVTVVKWISRVLPIATVLLLNACGGDTNADADCVVQGLDAIRESVSRTYTYDDLGRLVKEDLGDGRYIEYTYDKRGSLTRQTLIW